MCSEVEHKHSTNTPCHHPYIFFNHKFHFIFLNVIKASCYILFCSRLLFPFYTNYGHGHILLCVCFLSLYINMVKDDPSELLLYSCAQSHSLISYPTAYVAWMLYYKVSGTINDILVCGLDQSIIVMFQRVMTNCGHDKHSPFFASFFLLLLLSSQGYTKKIGNKIFYNMFLCIV